MTFPNPPADPTVNEEHSQGGKTWEWDGEKWNLKFNDQSIFTDEVFLKKDKSFIENLYQETLDTAVKPIIPNQESTNIALTEIIRNLKGSNVIISEFPPGTPDAYGNADVPEVGDLWIFDGTMTLYVYDGDQWVQTNSSCHTPVDAEDIGDITITGNRLALVLKNVPHTYTASVDDPTDVVFNWTTSDGNDVLTSTTGETVDITWASAGSKTVTVTALRRGSSDSGRTKVYNETALQYSLGNVAIDGPDRIATGKYTTFEMELEGGNVRDVEYSWSCVSANADDLTFEDGDYQYSSVSVNPSEIGTYELECVVSSVNAGGVSGDGDTPVIVRKTFEAYDAKGFDPVNMTVDGLDANELANLNVNTNTQIVLEVLPNTEHIPESDLTYFWLNDSSAGLYTWESDRDQKTVTISLSDPGSYTFRCNVGVSEDSDIKNDPDWNGITLQAHRVILEASVDTDGDVELELTGANGTNSYTSSNGDNPSVSIQVGNTLTIINNSGGHPVDVRVSDGGATVSTGILTGAPANDGSSLTWDTTGVTPGTYYYQCTSHPSMIGEIIVTS